MIEHPKDIRIEEYDYPLREPQIAKYPLHERDQSKLLFYNQGRITQHQFTDAPDLLPGDSLLVFNETKVVQARLIFQKPTSARIEIFVLEPYDKEVQEAFQSYGQGDWKCFVGNAKKWKEGELILSGENYFIKAHLKHQAGNAFIIHFEWNTDQSFSQILNKAGEIPLPPYLKRKAEPDDRSRYQTVYARHDGSVAAPTAGLHFTKPILQKLEAKGINTARVTLHVGAGTFKPVTERTIGEHEMHTEKIVVGNQTLQELKNPGRKIIAVGTTSVRTLESIYWYGVKLMNDPSAEFIVPQWLPYDQGGLKLPSKEQALEALMHKLEQEQSTFLRGETRLIIAPGYTYKIVSAMFTNFHLPKSTLLLLVAAYLGSDWRKVYDYALDNNFRFLSYGDSCLFIKE